MKVVAIIQARMGSSRLPGKVMMELAGAPMIDHVVRRALRIEGVDAVVVATSTHERDEPLVRFVGETLPVAVFRGSEKDVLSRYVGAAQEAGADVVVRLTADCPLLCPSVSARVVEEIVSAGGICDYASNTLERTFPRGLDTEAVKFTALAAAHREARASGEREHVTPFVWGRPHRFRVRSVRDTNDRSDWRLTVDTADDLELVRRVYASLAPEDPAFDYPRLVECLEAHPRWRAINRHVVQRGT